MVKKVSLAPKLDTAASADLRKALVDAQGDDLVLDASAVEMIGGQCLELLLTASVLWQQAGHSLTLENTSEQMTDDLSRFGITPDGLMEYAA
ncbi:MAG: STAS domain-containing protein [Pseudomonadota bacterium]